MDEPTGGLDPLVRDPFSTLLREFMEKGGRGVLFPHISPPIWINAQTILFLSIVEKSLLEEDKDALLDSWRLVKGDRASLTPERKPFCAGLRITDFWLHSSHRSAGESGDSFFPEALFDRACVDDIMIASCAKAGRILLKTDASCHRKLRKGGCESDESIYL